MSRIEIAAELCKACELCIAVCPKHCIEQTDTLNRYGVYPMRMREGAECIGCALCATMCPDTAIEVFRTVSEKPASAATSAPPVDAAPSPELSESA
ncbi:MAG: ferredoxin family protein [Thermoguttaceae bacterium]